MTVLMKNVDGVDIPCTPEEQAEIEREWALNDPAKQPIANARRVHPYYFRLRFTKAQRIAFATSTDPDVIDLSEAFRAADAIGLDDPRTDAGLNLLIAKGIIQSSDKAALLADRKVGEKP